MTPATSHPSFRRVRTETLRDLDARLAAATDDAERRRLRERLVVCAVPVADAVAHRFRERGVDVDDLEQIARAALVSATTRYDPAVGSGFLAFVVPSIVGEVKRYFRDHTWTVRPPRRLQELVLHAAAAEERLGHDLGRVPTIVEIAAALEVTAAQVHDLRRSRAAYRSSSLDDLGAAGDPTPLVADHAPDLADTVTTRLALADALSRLTAREQQILHLRFAEERSQAEIGAVIGVSQMQVSRLISGLLARLRPEVFPEAV